MLYIGTSYIVLIMLYSCPMFKETLMDLSTNIIFLKKAHNILGKMIEPWVVSGPLSSILLTEPLSWGVGIQFELHFEDPFRQDSAKLADFKLITFRNSPARFQRGKNDGKKQKKKRQGQGSFSLGASENGRNESDKIRSLLALDIF